MTIKDIAKMAGVSAQTVSNVVNNRIPVNEKTRQTILELVEKYGYKPSRIARSLRRGKTKTIGLVVPNLVDHPFYPRIFDILENNFGELGYNITIFNTKEEVFRENKAVDELLENKVDGILFIRTMQENDYLCNLPKELPIVACLRAIDCIDVSSVLTNNEMIGNLATQYLIDHGHRKIIHFAGDENLLAHRQRKIGYIETLKENNIPVNDDYIIHCKYTEENLYVKIINALEKIKDFTAIFAYNDIVAINCFKALNNIGYRVPDEVSLIGVDNIKFGEFMEPSLTTVEQPIEKICELSTKILVDLIKYKQENKDMPKQVIVCEPKLIERNSVKNIRN